MDRNQIVWVIECCALNLDAVSKEDMIRFGCPKELAEIGIKLCSFLANKEIIEGVKING